MTKTDTIDWPAVHQQLERGSQLLEAAFRPPPERVDEILAERAEALAQRRQTLTEQGARRTVLMLEIGTQAAAVEIHWVREVVNLTQGHAPVPDADALLLGVVNVHNQIVNLVNPWPLLNETTPAGANDAGFPMAVLLRHAHLSVAIGCSQVLNLVELPHEAWQSENLFLFGDEQRPAVLLDVSALLLPWEQQAQKAP